MTTPGIDRLENKDLGREIVPETTRLGRPDRLPSAVKALRAEIERLQNLPDHQDCRDALHDLVMLRNEHWAIGGGPGFKEREEKAWRAAEEIFEP